MNVPPPFSSIRWPFALTPQVGLLSVPSDILRPTLPVMFAIAPEELHGIPWAMSWYSGKEWGCKLGMHWLPNFTSSREWSGSQRLNFLPADATVAGEGKVSGTLELGWSNAFSINALTGDRTAECKPRLDPLTMQLDSTIPGRSIAVIKAR